MGKLEEEMRGMGARPSRTKAGEYEIPKPKTPQEKLMDDIHNVHELIDSQPRVGLSALFRSRASERPEPGYPQLLDAYHDDCYEGSVRLRDSDYAGGSSRATRHPGRGREGKGDASGRNDAGALRPA